jgi:hypothetical protein
MTGSPASLKVGRLLRAYDNLILNGQFTLDTANWTVQGSDTTFVSASGRVSSRWAQLHQAALRTRRSRSFPASATTCRRSSSRAAII